MTETNYLIEFIPNGRYVKVTAIDPATGGEAVLVGDARQSRERLARLAVQKLEFVLRQTPKN